jgi:SAM-dependent methyltransferase
VTTRRPAPKPPAAAPVEADGQESHADDAYQSRFYAQRYYGIVARQHYDPRIEAFLVECHRRHGRGRLRSALELACGPALVSLGLAARGVAVTCVDRSAAMLRSARKEAAGRGLAIRARNADMIGYRHPDPVQLAFCIGPSTSYVPDNAAMLRFLAGLRDSLQPGGVCILDFDFVPGLLHRQPASVEPPWLVFEGEGAAHALAARDGARTIEIRFGVAPTRYDPVTQRFRSHNEIAVRGTRGERVIRTASVGKLYFPAEMEALVGLVAGMELVETFGSFDSDARLHLASDRFVLLLRRAA